MAELLIDVKNREIQSLIEKATQEFNNIVGQGKNNVEESVRQINAILGKLATDIDKKIMELKGPVVISPAKDKNLGPRGKSDNPKLPDFWRRNYDYLESPYMNLDKIKKITDKPPYKKKRKISKR